MPSQQSTGEVPSWEELRQRAMDILRLGPARGWEPADWEDMAQEAVLKTIIAMANDKVDMQRFDPWFYKVCENVARNWHRRYGRDVSWQAAHDPEDTRVDAEIKARLDGQEVEVLLASLTSRERLVLQLTYWYDLTSREIAAVLGEEVPAATVRAWNLRALQKVRAHLRRT